MSELDPVLRAHERGQTYAGNDVVLDSFKVFEEEVFRTSFDAVSKIGDMVESYEWAGLQ